MSNLTRIVILLLALSMATLPLVTACSSDNEDNQTPLPVSTVTPTPTVIPTPTVTASGTTEEILWTGEPIVDTLSGTVRGFEDEANTWVWKAIPFARPPIGDLRWKAPQDPEPWDGIREETDFCSECPQYDAVGSGALMGNEDCLYLNIWRPQSDEINLPVYVWIHGGGNSMGTAGTPGFHGMNLASRSNMVFVSVNYRIGPFGWFTHPSLRSGEAGDEANDSGNYGTLDIIQSLKWINENIEAFGGDPDNVTITGESAGAVNVLSLMISPLAKNLFHKAMVQSGSPTAVPVSDGEESAQGVLLQLLINDDTVADQAAAQAYVTTLSDEEIATYLRSKSAEELFECYAQQGFGMLSFPYIFRDGVVIDTEGFETFKSGTYPNKVPIILGSNKEEMKTFMFMDPSFDGKDDLYQIITNYSSDFWKVSGVDNLARELSSHPDQPPVYAYQFLWGTGWDTGDSPISPPYDLKLGAAHSMEIPFFLGDENFFFAFMTFSKENRAGRQALTDAMMAYISNFARTGDPGWPSPDLPEWKPWDNAVNGLKCILFNVDGDLPDITMSDIEFTRSSIMESMQLNVAEPLYSEALEFMQGTVSWMTDSSD